MKPRTPELSATLDCMRRQALTVRRARGAVASAVFALVGCGAAPTSAPAGPAQGAQYSSDAACTASWTATVPAAPPVEAPKSVDSLLSVHFEVATRRVLSALEAQIPTLLDQAQRKPVGSAGKATYTVMRGPLGLGLSQDTLSIAAPIDIDLKVCKPLGPVCVQYARCSPLLLATASVPLRLNENLQLPAPRVTTSLIRSCTVLGLDLKDEIERRAAVETRRVERTLTNAIAGVPAWLQILWTALGGRFELGSACFQVQPQSWSYTAPTQRSGEVVGDVLMAAKLSPCGAARTKTPSLPAPELVRSAAPSSLHLPYTVPWSELLRALATEWQRTAPTEAASADFAGAMLRGVQTQRGPRVQLSMPFRGELCGTAVYEFSVVPAATGRSLRITDVRRIVPAPSEPAAADSRLTTFGRALEHSELDLTETLESSARELKKVLRRSGTELETALQRSAFTAKLQPSLTRPELKTATIADDGISVDLHTGGTIELEVQ